MSALLQIYFSKSSRYRGRSEYSRWVVGSFRQVQPLPSYSETHVPLPIEISLHPMSLRCEIPCMWILEAPLIGSNSLSTVTISTVWTSIGNTPAKPIFQGFHQALLQLIRQNMTGQQTLSITAPALYGWLREYPIAVISNVVDYIVYMTYDLHGQWDYDNPSSE
jgi:hypothetical protein